MQQYLLNPDGSWPAGAPVEALLAAGVTPVVPTPLPVADPGFRVVEAAPEFVDGAWRQVWRTEAAPPEPPVAPPALTPAQFTFLLALTGLEDVWTEVEAQTRTTDRALYALLRGSRSRDQFRWDETLRLIAVFAPWLPPGVDLSAAALEPLWMQAAAF